MRIRNGVASLGALTLIAGALISAPLLPAAADAPVTAKASGLAIVDSDGGTIQAPTPAVSWSAGERVSQELAELIPRSSSIANGYAISTQGTATSASDNGARVTVASANLGLRGRVPVVVSNLDLGCAPDGRGFVSFDSLKVGDVTITDAALTGAATTAGYRYDLPADSLGVITKLTVGGSTTAADGTVTTRGLRLVDDTGNFEVSSLTLGSISCTPHEQAVLEPHRVAGVQVLGAGGTRLIEPAAVISGPGASSVTVESATAEGVRTVAKGVTSTSALDGTVTVRVDSFAQTPRPGLNAELYPSALRVNGLTLSVAPGGASSVAFDQSWTALFADGRWLNSENGYIYSKVDDTGEVMLEAKINERIENGDGTVTVNALHYIDHTGVLPEVILGQATVSTEVVVPPTETPTPQPEEPAVPAGTWHAYGVQARGASVIAAQPLAVREGDSADEESADLVTDGGAGQISASEVRVNAGPTGASSVIAELVLFPDTAAEVRLSNLTASVVNGKARVTSDGGTVFGTTIGAGVIEPGTRFTVPGGQSEIVLAEVGADDEGLVTVSGLHFVADEGATADITAAHAAAGKPAVSVATTATSVSLSSASRKFGGSTRVTVRVTSSAGVAPSGSVRVFDGSRHVGSVSLKPSGRTGVGSLVLSKSTTVGSHSLSARYLGSATASASVSTARKLVVSKADSRASLSASKWTVARGARPVVKVTVKGASAATATGTVKVKVGGTVVGTVRLSGGSAKIRLPKVTSAKSVAAVYSGDKNYRSDTAAKRTVKVRR